MSENFYRDTQKNSGDFLFFISKFIEIFAWFQSRTFFICFELNILNT